MLDEMHASAREALDEGYVRSKLGLEATEGIAEIEMKEVSRKIEAAQKLATDFSRKLDGSIIRFLSKQGLKWVFKGKELAAETPERTADIHRRGVLARRLRRIRGGEVTPEERRRILGAVIGRPAEDEGAL